MTYINFKTFEEYLRDLESGQTDGQTDRQQKHFLTLLESVKNKNKIYNTTIRKPKSPSPSK